MEIMKRLDKINASVQMIIVIIMITNNNNISFFGIIYGQTSLFIFK